MATVQEELKKKYNQLYGLMATSGNPKNMTLFGETMTDMFDWMLDNKPALAQQVVDKLEAMRWKQYLTRDEAEEIVENMVPEAPWKYTVWENAMNSFGLETEREPVFNKYALWVEMNAKYSDHAHTMAEKIWMLPLKEVPNDKMVPAIYGLAIDSLTDKDGKFNTRKYYLSK